MGAVAGAREAVVTEAAARGEAAAATGVAGATGVAARGGAVKVKVTAAATAAMQSLGYGTSLTTCCTTVTRT